ncbi:MAG: isopenicillin N synthase family dioxygenase [Rhizobiaceae bacterium]
MAYAKAKSLTEDAIPVIDISGLRDNSNAKGVAEQLHAASQNLGFIYISGHGIPEEVIDAARSSAYEFFRSDLAQKSSVKVSGQHRGWIGQGGAKMQDDAKADLKESYIWGIDYSKGDAPDDHALRGLNQWPDFMSHLQTRSMDYFSHAHAVAHHLMRGFALGLGKPDNLFLRTATRPLSRASYVYYPAQPDSAGEDQFGVGPHTDFGVLTVLCQDSVGGLQVQDINGEWIEAPPIPGTLVVNVADLLSRWTGGAYKSTPHRVVNASGRERLSLVLAFDPNPETMIDVGDVFDDPPEVAEDPITCGDYLVWRFNKAFAYRSANK